MGVSKLADFGVSASGEKMATLIGTPFYLAPEVIVNEGFYDFKVDIWSLGITLIELADTVPVSSVPFIFSFVLKFILSSLILMNNL
jgi:serine/threonine protein kinase